MRFKEGRIKSVADEFNVLKGTETKTNLNEKETMVSTWINDIVYNERTVNLIETEVEVITEDKQEKKDFVYITDIKITKRNADEIIYFDRSRWKIENQGFNNQKTKRYHLEHANSLNYNAMKRN